MQAMNKKKIVKIKDDTVLTIDRKHPDYLNFVPLKVTLQDVQKEQEFAEQASSSSSSVANAIKIIDLYKPSALLKPIFADIVGNSTAYYNIAEVKDILWKYIAKNQLQHPTERSKVKLNPTLCDTIYKKSKGETGAYPAEVEKQDLLERFLDQLQPYHVVDTGDEESTVKKGTLKPIQIMVEHRQGKKYVTKVTGMESFGIDADTLANDLKTLMAASTSISPLPGKNNKNQEVMVQGRAMTELANHLMTTYSVPKKYIEVLDKTKPKK